MNSVGRQLLVAATMVLLAVAGGCSSDGDQPVDQSRRPGNAADRYPFERALVACYQDNGIDSELLPDGVIHRSGTLSREESRALSDLCDQRLEDEGFILHEEPSDGSTERTYNAWVAFRECMIDQGIAIGELGSLESYAANPKPLGNQISAALHEDLGSFKEAYDQCPSRRGLISISVAGA